MKFKNPTNGYVEEKSAPWLWTLLFGGLYFIVSGMWAASIVYVVITIFLYGSMGSPATLLMVVVNIFFAAFASTLVERAYLRKGWTEIGDTAEAEAIDPQIKKCPFCAEVIKAEARICRYCGKNQLVIASDLKSQARATFATSETEIPSKVQPPMGFFVRHKFAILFSCFLVVFLLLLTSGPRQSSKPIDVEAKVMESNQPSTNFSYKDFAREKKEECLLKRYPHPKTLTAEQFCEAYGNVQAICKHDGKTGKFCE